MWDSILLVNMEAICFMVYLIVDDCIWKGGSLGPKMQKPTDDRKSMELGIVGGHESPGSRTIWKQTRYYCAAVTRSYYSKGWEAEGVEWTGECNRASRYATVVLSWFLLRHIREHRRSNVSTPIDHCTFPRTGLIVPDI